jgi:hypothetical protein
VERVRGRREGGEELTPWERGWACRSCSTEKNPCQRCWGSGVLQLFFNDRGHEQEIEDRR